MIRQHGTMTGFQLLIRKAKTLFIYTVALHFFRIICDLLLPNAHWANRIRGAIFSPFFKKCGKRFALASGCIINCAWNIELGDDVYIAHNCWINAAAGLTIGSGCVISPGVVIATTAHARVNGQVSLQTSHQAPISIGAGTWIASLSVIKKGCLIGAGSVIGAGSIVSGKIEDNTLYAGNPVKLIRRLQ